MKKHIFYNHTPNPTSENICELCGKYFYDHFDVSKHLEKFHGKFNSWKRNTKCDTCGEVFKLVNDLNKHKMKVHKKAPYDVPITCDICGTQLKGQSPFDFRDFLISYSY